jgi:hypothetical protein
MGRHLRWGCVGHDSGDDGGGELYCHFPLFLQGKQRGSREKGGRREGEYFLIHNCLLGVAVNAMDRTHRRPLKCSAHASPYLSFYLFITVRSLRGVVTSCLS